MPERWNIQPKHVEQKKEVSPKSVGKIKNQQDALMLIWCENSHAVSKLAATTATIETNNKQINLPDDDFYTSN